MRPDTDALEAGTKLLNDALTQLSFSTADAMKGMNEAARIWREWRIEEERRLLSALRQVRDLRDIGAIVCGIV